MGDKQAAHLDLWEEDFYSIFKATQCPIPGFRIHLLSTGSGPLL